MNNKKVNAIIVDDEKGCIANLEYQLAKFCPDIHVRATYESLVAITDKTLLSGIDIAFLDVELFDENIFLSLQKIEKIDFRIVFVTAYEKYAVKAWRVDALDYILKPLSEDDIQNCYLKIKKYFSMSVMESRPAKHDLPAFHEDKKIILRDSDNVFIIKKEDILYISGNGFYSAISFILGGKHKSVVISKPLSKVEAEYHYNTFYRVHKSYIINVENIEKISKEAGLTIKMKDGKLITVAKRRIHDFYSFLNNAG